MPDPGEDYQRWSPVADNNGDVDPLIDWHEGQARRTVNNSARSEMAAHAKNRNLLNGSIITTGLPNAQAFLSGVNYLTVPTGLRVMLRVGLGLDNTTALTLNMDGIGAVMVKKPDLNDTTGGEFKSDRYVELIYNGNYWIYLYSAGNFAPTDDPVFDGDPQVPTPPPDDNNHSIANTEWVRNLIFGGRGIVLSQQVFATAGTFTYTPTSGMKSCIIECIGGGGGGGAAWTQGTITAHYTGGGGGSGGYSRTHATGDEIGSSQSITVGAAGAGGTPSGPGAGQAGSATFVGTAGSEICKANGGGGGLPGWLNQMPHAGAGATAGIGDFAVAGTPGENGTWTTQPADGPDPIMFTGNGAPGALGGGARTVLAATGAAASGYGAGGAGGSAFRGEIQPIGGGKGSGGVIIITEFSGSGAPGPTGPAGPAGPQGPIGPVGPAGPGTGDVIHSGTPTNGQLAQWTDASHIKGIDISSLGFAPIDSPILTGDCRAPTPATSDNDNSIATTSFVQAVVAAASGGSGSAPLIAACGRLTLVSATALKFAPFNGDRIKINGEILAIPTAGIAGLANTSVFVEGTAGQNLAANTTYYVYAFVNSGVVTGDFSTIGHATSVAAGNAGTEIKTGNNTRTLIGMCRTNASSQFVDSATKRFVVNWFNRQSVGGNNNLSVAGNTSSAAYTEMEIAARVEMLVWSGEAVLWGASGVAYTSSAAGNACVGVGFDGIVAEPQQTFTNSTANPTAGFAFNGVKSALSDGYHYATILASNSAGQTTTLFGSTPPTTNPSSPPCCISFSTQG